MQSIRINAAYGADITSALQNAVNTLSGEGGGVVYIPGGGYFVSGVINITNASISIVGESAGQTLLIFNNITSGFNISLNEPVYSFRARDFAIQARGVIVAGPAIKVVYNYPNTVSSQTDSVDINNIHFESLSVTEYVAKGLYLERAHQSKIRGVHMRGILPVPYADMLCLDAIAIAQSSDVFISQCRVFSYKNAVRIMDGATGFSEGVTIEQCTFVQVHHGVNSTNSGTNEQNHGSIINSHIAARRRCVLVAGGTAFFISNSLFYNREDARVGQSGSATADFAFVEFNRTRPDSAGIGLHLTNMMCWAHLSDGGSNTNVQSAMNGVVLNGINTTHRNSVVENIYIANTNTGVWFQSGTSGLRLRGLTTSNVPSPVIDQGSGNIIQ
jgi:hypothetical protein